MTDLKEDGRVPSGAFRVDQHSIVAVDHFDDSFSPDAGMLRLIQHDQWWSGDFVDYRGIVTVYREATILRLDAVADGRCHVRTWRQYFGDRTVARLCRAFLTDLHGAPSPKDQSYG